MRTRSGLFYLGIEETLTDREKRGRRKKREGCGSQWDGGAPAKKWCRGEGGGDWGFFEGLPDDLVLYVLCSLSSSAASPSDLISVRITCKRMNQLGKNPVVLAKASSESLAIRANRWSESAHTFLMLCADAGNLEACYTLGMIRFYCLGNRAGGAALMARAAMGCHTAALYSLAVIQFNGSGGSKSDKDLRAGAALCARAASLGHIDALRELGHCLQDGYGVRRSIADGRRFLLHANARELAAFLAAGRPKNALGGGGVSASAVACSLMSDFGCVVPPPEPHPANRFLGQWFGCRFGSGIEPGGLRMCSNRGCGRPETRRHEFRRCSVCGAANYCSRACQALHWKTAHRAHCIPMDRWFGGAVAAPPVE